MANTHSDFRKRQAERELGTTAVRRWLAAVLTVVFLATIWTVPLAEEALRLGARDADAPPAPLALLELPGAVAEAARTLAAEGLIAADLELLAAMKRSETRLEERSFLRAWLLPRVQGALLAAVGLGNEQVYPGRDGWLFYRADVDHVTGRGFLDPDVLRERRRGGDAWEAPPEPDPLPALIAFERALAARGVELIVMPTPLKPTVQPDRFARRAAGVAAERMRNPSYGEWVDRLQAAGIEVFDPLTALAGEPATGGEAAYLRTDTHWSPGAMERVAAALAAELDGRHALGPESTYYERPATVRGRGDLAGMLRLPEGSELVPDEQVTIRTVTDPSGASWRPRPDAAVLVLGDSFTNVFSDPRLGWGAAAGLAERLSFHLRRPVDRIALNAGGSHAAREALARDLAGGRDRLAGKVVVVYQFAARELSQGDWRLVPLSR